MAIDRFTSLKDITTANGGKESYNTDASKGYGGVFGDSLFYPNNLGTVEANHYVVFFINELQAGRYASKINQRKSSDSPVFMQTGSTAGVKILDTAGTAVGKMVSNGVDSVAKMFSMEEDLANAKKFTAEEDLANTLAPDYQRTTTCIALPPPENINTSFDAEWQMVEAPSLSILALGGDALNTFNTEGLGAAVKQVAMRAGKKGISKFATNMVGEVGNLITKSVNNPRREMTFKTMAPRRFAFQWNLFPRTPSEAKSIWDIIQMFKYHMLPEIDNDPKTGTSGLFIQFPNTFDIEYHSNGGRNNWLPKSSTCALTRVDINYTPGGSYGFFKEIMAGSVKNYPDGAAPIGIVLALEFAELETMYRNRIDPGADYTFGAGQGSDRGTF